MLYSYRKQHKTSLSQNKKIIIHKNTNWYLAVQNHYLAPDHSKKWSLSSERVMLNVLELKCSQTLTIKPTLSTTSMSLSIKNLHIQLCHLEN